MAVKKAIPRRVSSTRSVASPPGSTEKPSATSARIVKLMAWRAAMPPKGSPGLGDRVTRRQHEHQRPQDDPVHHEPHEPVPRHEAQQERDRPVADDEREDRRD